METITASLERSFRNCSLSHGNGVGEEEDDDIKVPNGVVSNNSDISLPRYWEQQCLDLKTGEDSRTVAAAAVAEYDGDFSSEEDDDEGDSWYDSEDYSSPESSPSKDYNNNSNNRRAVLEEENADLLVVGGCKSCYMYFMVPKKAEGCPRCNGHLLRFDRSPSNPPSSP
ncbi:hypothetical protein V6N13_117339 [Hibiscus sabdariffa]|uniref:Uncharacterized protein n=1 Tax=Hibiscus sabdariffa TaxID=183260 RepID=A0ABR2PAL3_9ROSI